MPDDITTDVTETEDTLETPEAEEGTDTTEDEPANGDTFSRAYVEKLRRQAEGLRSRAQDAEARAEDLSQRLHTALVAATGRLQDAGDLAYSPEHLESDETLTASIDALLSERPHLKARRITGDAGLGVKGTDAPQSDFLSLARAQL